MDKTKGNTRVILRSEDYELEDSYLIDKKIDTVYVFANNCYLSGTTPIVKTREFHLHTSSFTVYDTSDSGRTIDASGPPGQGGTADNDKSKRDGKNGGDGYNVFFTSSNFDVSRALKIKSQGGSGGRGAGAVSDVPAGDGGNGGTGGSATLIFKDSYSRAFTATADFYRESDYAIWKAKLKAWLNLCLLTIAGPPSLLQTIRQFSDSYLEMDESEARRSLEDLSDTLDASSTRFMVENVVTNKGGDYGVAGSNSTESKNGEPGKRGETPVHQRMTNKTIMRSSEIIFHPDQVAMTIRDIENNYFIGTRSSLSLFADSLNTLVQRLSFLPDLQKSDPLYQAYAAHESSLCVLQPKVDPTVPASITSLNQSLEKARGYVRQFSRGYDFYGHEETWVPRGTYDRYTQQLNTLLGDIDGIEANYLVYKDKESKFEKKRTAIEDGQRVAKSIIERTVADKEQLETEMTDAAKLIGRLTPVIRSKREALKKVIQGLSQKIQDGHNGVTFADFTDAAGQMVFAPGGKMAIVQIAKLFHDDMVMVTDDLGDKVDKTYLVNKLLDISGNIQTLKEELQLVSGYLEPDDPGAAKLLLEEKALLDLIGMYSNLLGHDTLKDVKAQFDDYVDTVLTQNSTVIRYNARVMLWLEARTSIETQTSRLETLNAQKLDEDIVDYPAMALFVEQSYFISVTQVLRLLYLTERALSFWSLGARTELTSLREGGFTQQRGLAQLLKSARDSILINYVEAMGNFISHTQAFGDASGDEGRIPITFPLNPTQCQSLCGDIRMVGITIPPAYSFTESDQSPFYNCADVRISKARFYIDGVSTDNGMLDVTLEHLGRDSMVDLEDARHEFTHKTIRFKFRYEISTRRIFVDGDIEDLVRHDSALPGPFAQWFISIPEKYNKGLRFDLDPSNVKAYFEFHGWCRTFG